MCPCVIKRANQVAAGESIQYLGNIGAALSQNLLGSVFVGAREQGGKSGGVPHQDDGLAGLRGRLGGIDE